MTPTRQVLPEQQPLEQLVVSQMQVAVVPLPDPIRVPLAFGMPLGEPELAGFVNSWIELKRHDGTFDELYQYWILGKNATPTPPRWSIIRDVLHWVE